MNSHDRRLGMDRPIDRRQFVNGVAAAVGASLLPKWSWAIELDRQAARPSSRRTTIRHV
jgi:hypothetical protein